GSLGRAVGRESLVARRAPCGRRRRAQSGLRERSDARPGLTCAWAPPWAGSTSRASRYRDRPRAWAHRGDRRTTDPGCRAVADRCPDAGAGGVVLLPGPAVAVW